jgi:transcriptional regulator with XRE-family HTH domain
VGRLNAKYETRRRTELASHIGAKILKMRRKKNWTLKDVEHHAGIQDTYVGYLENGNSEPGASMLLKLSRAFGVPVSYWFSGFDGKLR